jgi:lysophospholipase L1-like esterase
VATVVAAILVGLLRDLVRASRNAGTRVALATSPQWAPPGADESDYDRLLAYLDAFAREEDVPFIQITRENTPLFRDPELFADPQHMNVKGSEIFSRMLAERLLERRILERGGGGEPGYEP